MGFFFQGVSALYAAQSAEEESGATTKNRDIGRIARHFQNALDRLESARSHEKKFSALAQSITHYRRDGQDDFFNFFVRFHEGLSADTEEIRAGFARVVEEFSAGSSIEACRELLSPVLTRLMARFGRDGGGAIGTDP